MIMTDKNTAICIKTTINCRGRLLDLSTPRVMGILNVTPDSFFADSRHKILDDLMRSCEKMLTDGADILDVGGVSTRPGAADVSIEEELDRVVPAIEAIAKRFPEAIISIDTYRARVAREAVHAGAAMVNDISAGKMDEAMYSTVATMQVPYILMHMQSTPATMQQDPQYDNVGLEVLDFLVAEVAKIRALGVNDIILDPGFGFGKTVEHNFQLLQGLEALKITGLPILAGLSRKSMVCRTLGVKPSEALNGTTALNTIALLKGAKILRVHDVKEAVECVRLVGMMGLFSCPF
ncbi:dihydropteroate synthase [soil metagenome]